MCLLRIFALGLLVVAPHLAWAQAQVPVPGGYAITSAPLCPLGQAQVIGGVSYAAGQISVPCGSYGTVPTSALPGSFGSDHSSAAPALLPVCQTIAANPARVGFFLQDQSTSQVQVVLDHDMSGTNYTVVLVDPGAGANAQGADWSFAQAGIRHTGQIRTCSAAGAQYGATEF